MKTLICAREILYPVGDFYLFYLIFLFWVNEISAQPHCVMPHFMSAMRSFEIQRETSVTS